MPVREEHIAAEAFGASASNAAPRTRRVGVKCWEPYRSFFSTSGTFVEALQIYDALERKSGRRQVFIQGDFVEAYVQFRHVDGGAVWLERALSRLEVLGVSEDARARFSTAYRGAILRYVRDPDCLALDVGGRLEKTIENLIADLSVDDDTIDLTSPHGLAPTSVVRDSARAHVPETPGMVYTRRSGTCQVATVDGSCVGMEPIVHDGVSVRMMLH